MAGPRASKGSFPGLSHPLQSLQQPLHRGPQSRGLTAVLPGKIVPVALEVERRQGAVRPGVIGIETDRLLQGREHGVFLSKLSVRHGQEVMGLSQLRSSRYDTAELFGSRLRSALP